MEAVQQGEESIDWSSHIAGMLTGDNPAAIKARELIGELKQAVAERPSLKAALMEMLQAALSDKLVWQDVGFVQKQMGQGMIRSMLIAIGE